MAHFSSKYGVARHIFINIPKAGSANHAVGADWTPAAGDVKISKDGGAAANVTNLPTAIAMGNSAIWDFSITATEMQAAQVNITVSDSATKAVDDTGFVIETYGNASAQHEFDLDTSSVAQTGDNYARLGAPAGASIAADLLVIDNFVDGIESTLASGVALSATGLDAVPYTATGAVALAKAVWTDTLVTYTNGMAGKRLRGISAVPVIEGTINDAAATTTSFITSLTGYGTNFFNDSMCIIEYATDKWQANAVSTYNTATGAMTFSEAFYAAPANGLNIVMFMTHVHPVAAIQAGLATQVSVDALPTAIENADALLNRDMATGTDSGSPTVRTVRQALRFLRNKWSMSGATLTVFKENDTDASWTSTVSTDAAAIPVVGNDPAG